MNHGLNFDVSVFFFLLQSLFPGLWLSEVTVDTYKVPDLPDNGKVMF